MLGGCQKLGEDGGVYFPPPSPSPAGGRGAAGQQGCPEGSAAGGEPVGEVEVRRGGSPYPAGAVAGGTRTPAAAALSPAVRAWPSVGRWLTAPRTGRAPGRWTAVTKGARGAGAGGARVGKEGSGG